MPSALEILKEFAKSRSNEKLCIGYMEIGSSSISLETRRWLKEFFPRTKIWHHFGMTEASRSFFIERGAKDKLEEGFDIGDAAPGVSWKIRRKTSKNKGELWIAGKNLATSYPFDSSLTKERFRNGGFYRRFSKLTDGKIKLVGRLDSKINVGGLKLIATNRDKPNGHRWN